MTDIRDLAHRAGLDGPGWTYDTALPLDWCRDVERLTGRYPAEYMIVWAYGPRSVWGGPKALDPAATALLRTYADRLQA